MSNDNSSGESLSLAQRLFLRKPIEDMESDTSEVSLKKNLTLIELIMFAVGAIVGTGLFALTGIVAAKYAGPAVMICYLISGIVAMFTALAYVEMSSYVSSSGSSYSYSYASLGEFIGWIVAWFMMLEYTLGSVIIASSWSAYITGLLDSTAYSMPEYLTKTPFEGGVVNLPAVFIVLFLTTLLVRGTKESSWFNTILVILKIAAIAIFVFLAVPKVNFANWENFVPFGFGGILTGSAALIFSYAGFDALTAAAEETKNPKRDLPLAIIISIIICILLFMIVCAALTLITHYSKLDNAESIAYALRLNGYTIGSALVAVGASSGITTALMVQLYGQSRVIFVIARDGLMPRFLTKLHKKYATPYVSTWIVGLIIAIGAGFIPIGMIIKLANVGSFVAFIAVALGVLVIKRKMQKENKGTKGMLGTMVNYGAPIAAFLSTALLIKLYIEQDITIPLTLWLLSGIIIYLFYGIRNSILQKKYK